MECHEVSDLLSAYIDGELDPVESKSVVNHLSGCNFCRQELSELQQTINLLHELPDLAPPPDLCLRVMNRIKAEPKKRMWLKSRRWFSFGAVAAAILLFIVSAKVFSSDQIFLPLADKSQEIVADSSVAPAEQEIAGENQLNSIVDILHETSGLEEDIEEIVNSTVKEREESASDWRVTEESKTKQNNNIVQYSAENFSDTETTDNNTPFLEINSVTADYTCNSDKVLKHRGVNYRDREESQMIKTEEATSQGFDYNITLHSENKEQVNQEISQIVYSLGGNVLNDDSAYLEVAIPSARIDVAFAAFSDKGIAEVHQVSKQDVNQVINYLKSEQESLFLKIKDLERSISQVSSQENLAELELLIAQYYEDLKTTQLRLKTIANGNTIVKIYSE